MSVASSCFPSRLRTTYVWFELLLISAAALSLTGCMGEASYGNRVPLVGTVTKGGKPLTDNATIYFDPMGGEGGIGSAGEVSQGKFTIPEESGPTPGRTYKVTVRTAPGIPAPGTPRNQIRVAQTYETTVEIPPRDEDAPELVIDFK
jgi:hypothetical protein